MPKGHELKKLIEDLKESSGASALREREALESHQETIGSIEKRIKESRAKLKELRADLEFKLELKRVGCDDSKTEKLELIAQIDAEIATLDPDDNKDKRKITALKKARQIRETQIAAIDVLFAQIGGKLTDEDAKALILRKLFALAHQELNRYLNAEKRRLNQAVESLWDKYAVSRKQLESRRVKTLGQLDGFLKGLRYFA